MLQRIAYFLFICSLWLFPHNLWAKDALVWHVSHFPPANILSGEFQGQGFADRTRQFFQERILDFDHIEATNGFAASMEAAKAGTLLCRGDLLKTPEREEIFHYSKPIYFMSGRRLIVPSAMFNNVRKFANKNGDVRFDDLLQQDWAKFSYVKGRAYFDKKSPVLAEYIAKHPALGTDTSKQAYDLFAKGEANLLILYPFEYLYYLRSEKARPSQRSLQVMNMQPFAYGYFACTKTETGKQIIQQVDKIIDHHTGLFPWLEYYKDWVPEDEWKRVLRAFYKVVGSAK